jgi:transcriptional regulator with XRE-family HTH domain
MTLAEYVDRIMTEKRLTAYDVQQNSNGEISDSYVLRIREGTSKRPSAQKLRALARGLGVDFNDLMAVASGGEPGKTWTAESLRDAINKMVDDENLGEAVKVLIGKPPGEVKKALKYLRRK